MGVGGPDWVRLCGVVLDSYTTRTTVFPKTDQCLPIARKGIRNQEIAWDDVHDALVIVIPLAEYICLPSGRIFSAVPKCVIFDMRSKRRIPQFYAEHPSHAVPKRRSAATAMLLQEARAINKTLGHKEIHTWPTSGLSNHYYSLRSMDLQIPVHITS